LFEGPTNLTIFAYNYYNNFIFDITIIPSKSKESSENTIFLIAVILVITVEVSAFGYLFYKCYYRII